ncbi:MAG: hypothetical protein ACR2JO_06355 [Mycobacteriales bacterium]
MRLERDTEERARRAGPAFSNDDSAADASTTITEPRGRHLRRR